MLCILFFYFHSYKKEVEWVKTYKSETKIKQEIEMVKEKLIVIY